MRTQKEITDALNAIRAILDTDIIDVNIEEQQRKLLSLTQMFGLSAEAKATAKKLLHLKELDVLSELTNKSYSATILSKFLTARTAHEIATLEYADRINAAITHSCDSIRTIISLYKEELKQNMNEIT